MNFRKMLSFAKANNIEEVTVLSYGYMERNLFTEHFEPFKNKRTFKFSIDFNFASLDHPWLYFEQEEDEEYVISEGKIICDDPDLWSRE